MSDKLQFVVLPGHIDKLQFVVLPGHIDKLKFVGHSKLTEVEAHRSEL